MGSGETRITATVQPQTGARHGSHGEIERVGHGGHEGSRAWYGGIDVAAG